MSQPLTDDDFAASEDASRWCEVLARVTAHQAEDFDALAGAFDEGRAETPGKVIFPANMPKVLGKTDPQCRVAIGVRIDPAEPDLHRLAARLAALAVERGCEVITLSKGDRSGLERFGFRNERIAGDTAVDEEICASQIQAFWGLEVII